MLKEKTMKKVNYIALLITIKIMTINKLHPFKILQKIIRNYLTIILKIKILKIFLKDSKRDNLLKEVRTKYRISLR